MTAPDPAQALQLAVMDLARAVSDLARRHNLAAVRDLPATDPRTGRPIWRDELVYRVVTSPDGRVDLEATETEPEHARWTPVQDLRSRPEPHPGQDPDVARLPRGLLLHVADALLAMRAELQDRAAARVTETDATVARIRRALAGGGK